MIHVECAPEPPDFDTKVRKPGLRAIAEMLGESPEKRRPGRPRKDEGLYATLSDIPTDRLESYWTRALPDLLTAYDRICAYVCVYIEHVTGGPSVEHVLPKSRRHDRIYEWDNYRLVCSLMNARKGTARDILDPFHVKNGWFEMELVGYQVKPSPSLPPEIRTQVEATIMRLDLNDYECRTLREDYATHYLEGDISLRYLNKRAPFVAMELERQNKLREEDR